MHEITTPFTQEAILSLRAGDKVLLSGKLYTGRDAAHKRMIALLDAGQPLPIALTGQAIYYVGPCPPKPGDVIGSCGPTTSGRMDSYTPMLLDMGLKAMIGKGQRNQNVIQSMVKNGAVYLAATGGAGALLAKCVKSSRVVAFPDLGTEAIHELTIFNMPLIVAIDSYGCDLYEVGPKQYCI